MTPKGRSLWGSLPGQRLMRLALLGKMDAQARAKFAPLIAQLKESGKKRDK